MRKSSFFYFSFAALLAAGLSSCQEEDLGFDEEAVHEAAVLREYQKNFESRYGTIDPNHDWGFKDIVIPVNGNSVMGTRALPGTWVNPTEPSQQLWYDTYGVVPPGAPADWNTNSPYGQDWTGAVTAEEILWVSEYFRTHTYKDMVPDMVQLHLTDFFVESVSGDDDQDGYAGVHGEGNQIYQQDGVRATITYGMDMLLARTMDSSDDYSTWHHINNFNYGSTVNRPQQYADNSVNPYLPKDNEGHVALDLVNPIDNDVDKDIYGATKSQSRNRTLMYVHSSGTESFAFHPSWDDQSSFYESYVLVHLSFDVNGHHYDGNYLAFDWQGVNDGDVAEPDGYYNNWIIKITPANYKPHQNFPVSRIMCEDLGNTLDFDFNDLVFDVKYEMTYPNGVESLDAILIIQAAGGTLPIWVGKKDNNYEAHYLLGNAKGETDTPINVAATIKGKTHDVAIVRIPLVEGTDWSTENGQVKVNPNDIKIWVGNNTASLVTAAALLPTAGGTAGQSAPKKISIPYTDTRWLKENQQIEWGYKHFDEWVKNQKSHDYFVWNQEGTDYIKDWDNGKQVPRRNPDAWTEADKDVSFLY